MQIIFESVHGNNEIYMDCLRSICGETENKSMVDLGCNLAPYTPKLGFKDRFYVDILERVLDHKDEQQYFIKEDILEFLKKENYFDVTLSLDSIEHLSFVDGVKLIRLMEWNSDKQVIFTPLHEWMMDLEGTEPEGHHSLWTPDLIPDYASIVFPIYHPTLNIGAWFGWQCKNIEDDFERVKNELKQKTWANNLQVHYS